MDPRATVRLLWTGGATGDDETNVADHADDERPNSRSRRGSTPEPSSASPSVIGGGRQNPARDVIFPRRVRKGTAIVKGTSTSSSTAIDRGQQPGQEPPNRSRLSSVSLSSSPSSVGARSSSPSRLTPLAAAALAATGADNAVQEHAPNPFRPNPPPWPPLGFFDGPSADGSGLDIDYDSDRSSTTPRTRPGEFRTMVDGESVNTPTWKFTQYVHPTSMPLGRSRPVDLPYASSDEADLGLPQMLRRQGRRRRHYRRWATQPMPKL